jgi:hypothetical protein
MKRKVAKKRRRYVKQAKIRGLFPRAGFDLPGSCFKILRHGRLLPLDKGISSVFFSIIVIPAGSRQPG